jgi:hypothetical protein
MGVEALGPGRVAPSARGRDSGRSIVEVAKSIGVHEMTRVAGERRSPQVTISGRLLEPTRRPGRPGGAFDPDDIARISGSCTGNPRDQWEHEVLFAGPTGAALRQSVWTVLAGHPQHKGPDGLWVGAA